MGTEERTDEDRGQDTGPYAILTEAESSLKGHWIAGALEAEGIPTFVEEDNLADEFAMSQKMAGLGRVRVLVPEGRVTEAQAIFLTLSQPIPLVDDDNEADEQEADEERVQITGKMVLWMSLILLLLFVGIPFLVRAFG